MPAASAHSLLPHAVPADADLRLVLYALRRMAAGGIGDAHAANAYLTAFGIHFRRPLVLTRTFVTEMSRAAQTKLVVAPCCCPRMSASEHAMIEALITVEQAQAAAHAALVGLLKVRRCISVVASAEALAAAFADLGRPLTASA